MKQNKVSAVVLAGGGSTRMGQNKALLQLGEKTMIERIVDKLRPLFEEIILVTNHPEEYPMLKDVEFVRDKMCLEDKNSMLGIYTGLSTTKKSHILALPCDMPFLNQDLIKYMISQLGEEDIMVPYIKGFYQPLHAIYAKKCLATMENELKNRNYKMISFLKKMNTKIIGEEKITNFSQDLACFRNVNTYQSYLDIKDYWG